MTNEKQLKELFKYIEQKWDVAVESTHKTDIKRIFGGVVLDEPTEKTSSQVKHDNSFDRDRFERVFCAVVASNRSDNEFIETEQIIQQLDAFYAEKNN